VLWILKKKTPVLGNGGSTDTAFAVERRLYSYSSVTAAPSIAIDMYKNIVRHTETDVCRM